MAIPSKQIGQSAEANLLWNISKQLDNLRKTSSIVDPALLAKIDELITVSSEIEISAENINLNTDDLETLITEGNLLLEEIRDNTASGSSFDGQLTQGGDAVSDTNPLPVTFTGSIETAVLSDTTFQDSTGQLFIYRDNGIDTPLAYKIPEWTVYTPVGAVTATSSPLTNYSLETGGNLEDINTQTLDIPNVISTEGGAQPTKGVVVMGHTGAGVVKHILVDTNGIQSVKVNSSTLPTGAATEAKQDTGNTSLSNIDADLGTIADSAWSGTGNGSLIAIQKALWNKFLMDASGNLKVNTSATTFTYSPNNSTNGNSSVFGLANGGTWNGTLENTINQPYLVTTINSNQNVILTIAQFIDAAGTIKAVPDIVFSVTANIPYPFPLAVQGNFIRLSVTNTSGSSANLYVDSYYGSLPVQPNSLTQAGNFKTSVQEQQVITSSLNSSSTQLGAGATFNGAWETVLNTASTQVGVVSDQPITITISQAIDSAGTKVVSVKTYTRLANQPFGESLLVVGAYQKVTVQNTGASTTTTLAISTIYTPVMNQSPVGPDNSGNMPVGIGQQVYGSTNAVYVGGTSQVQVTPTVTSASAYVAGNVVGGLLTFTNAVNSTVLSGVLESISIAVKSLQTTSFKLYIFKGVPSTTFTDKTAPAIVTADAVNLLDVYSFTTPDNGLGNNVTLYYSDAINRSLVLTNSSLYAVLICLGTPTFTSTTDVVVTASILRD